MIHCVSTAGAKMACGNSQTDMPTQVFRISLIAFLNLTSFFPKLVHCDPFKM